MSHEEAKRIHRRMVKKVGRGTYNTERDSRLWNEAQLVLFGPITKSKEA